TKSRILRSRVWIVAILLALACTARAQFSAQPPDQPPRGDEPLVENTWEQLSNDNVDALGHLALDMNPRRWKHAETEHFIIHFRRLTEAQKVKREVEYDLWFVAKTLGATKEQYKIKPHVFVFEDEIGRASCREGVYSAGGG